MTVLIKGQVLSLKYTGLRQVEFLLPMKAFFKHVSFLLHISALTFRL